MNNNPHEQQQSRAESILHYFRNKEGRPLDLESRPYWKQIYNENSRFIVLMTGRQLGKSTFLATRAVHQTLSCGKGSILLTTASKDQLRDLRENSILPHFERNPTLKRRAFKSGSINNASSLQVSNGSVIFLRAIGTRVNSARGISAKTIIADEVQDIPKGNLDVIFESAANFPSESSYLFLGTCKEEENLMYQLFLDTCQYEWIIPCKACSEDNPPISMEHLDLELEYLFCVHCKAPLDTNSGDWVAQNPNCQRVGYRMPRLIDPHTKWRSPASDGILDKYENYTRDRFLNEVMCLPSVSGQALITRQELESFCDDRPMMLPGEVSEEVRQKPSIATLDWAYNTKEDGASHSIISISQVEHDHIKVLFMKRFSGPQYDGVNGPQLVLDEIVSLVGAYNIDWVLADHRIGNKENLRLRQRIGKRMVEVEYSSGSHPVRWKRDQQRFSVPRTQSMDRLYNQLRSGRFKFPNSTTSMPFLEDIMNVYTEYDADKRTRLYRKSGKGPDDFLHLLNYTLITAIEHYGTRISWLNKFDYRD